MPARKELEDNTPTFPNLKENKKWETDDEGNHDQTATEAPQGSLAPLPLFTLREYITHIPVLNYGGQEREKTKKGKGKGKGKTEKRRKKSVKEKERDVKG